MDDSSLNNLNEVQKNTSGVTVVKRNLGSDYRSQGFGLQIKSDGMASPFFGDLGS
jgi:outer membrane receptor for ferric coprogen and ferric-rhodotorulic acid